MEIHPDALEDPEDENEWVLPSLPDPTSVPDNTKSWHALYFWRGQPRLEQMPVALAITREILPPWRRGVGIMVRHRQRAFAVGLWFPGEEPQILSGAPDEKDWKSVVTKSELLEEHDQRMGQDHGRAG